MNLQITMSKDAGFVKPLVDYYYAVKMVMNQYRNNHPAEFAEITAIHPKSLTFVNNISNVTYCHKCQTYYKIDGTVVFCKQCGTKLM